MIEQPQSQPERSDRPAPHSAVKPRTMGGAVAGGLAILGIVGFAATALLDRPSQAAKPPTPEIAASFAAPSFADLVARVAPSVVSIRVTQEIQVGAGGQGRPGTGFPPGHPLERFFDRRNGPQGDAPVRKSQAQGSGFVISADGYVVTNNHVVEKGTDISVHFNDDEEYQAELIGRDPKTDLALLKIESGEPLPFVEFDKTDALRVGDWVIAVGNPFGLGGTVTTGIVSARGRDIGAGPYDDFIQIDASINQGNSGGPAFGTNGEVVGVNTAIYSPNGGSVGIGFAIPAAVASKVIAQLKADGKVSRGWLGVAIQPIDPDMAESLGLSAQNGAVVSEVAPNGPAEKSGFKAGDVILKVNGAQIEDARDVSRRIADMGTGEKAELIIWRDGEEKSIAVIIGLFPERVELAAGEPDDERSLRLGLALVESPQGVLVENVAPGSQAALKGVSPGDIIVQVGTKKIATPQDVADSLEQARDNNQKSVLMLIKTAERQRFVALALGEA